MLKKMVDCLIRFEFGNFGLHYAGKQYCQAIKRYEKAAVQGNVDAMERLCRLYNSYSYESPRAAKAGRKHI